MGVVRGSVGTYCPTDPSATHLTIHTDQRQIYIILTLVLGPIESIESGSCHTVPILSACIY
jgi:hypothetical protein